MLTKDSLFTFEAENQMIFLDKDQRVAFMQGSLCPNADSISLEFELSSDLLGVATETLKIPLRHGEVTLAYTNT